VRRVTASFDPRETREEKSIVGTFTTAHVILAKAKKAVCRTHDLQGIFTIELRRSGDGQQLHVAESATAIQEERDPRCVLAANHCLRTSLSCAVSEFRGRFSGCFASRACKTPLFSRSGNAMAAFFVM